jgi:hypothetical protein
VSTTNNAVLYSLGADSYMVGGGVAAGPSGVRGTAPRVPSQCSRVTLSAVANGAFVLPSILSGEDYQLMWVINDSANAIVVSAAPGETMNGVASTGNLSAGILTIPAGQSGVFVPVSQEVSFSSTGDWRASVVA